MEKFVAINGAPLSIIELAVGETKIVGVKKSEGRSIDETFIVLRNSKIASCERCVHLGDPTKKKYDGVYSMRKVSEGNVSIESFGRFYVQICGLSAGTGELRSFFWDNTRPNFEAPYAEPIPVKVTPNNKLLQLPGSGNKPLGNFDTIWGNHPYVAETSGYPCGGETKAPLYNMQCMVRVWEALHKSGVLHRHFFGSQCQLPGAEHRHHFSNPYDFPFWPPAVNTGYIWSAKPPYEPEPMPGVAAFNFVRGRQGIIVFWNYFTIKGQTSMQGGHIDLWNKDRMGNNVEYENPTEGEAAFFRAKKVGFWPLVPIA